MSKMSKKNVVILGGGAAGASVAHILAPQLSAAQHTLTLIDERPFYTHIIAGLRATVTAQGDLAGKMFFPLDALFPKGSAGRFLAGRAESIDATHVHLEGGESVPYDVLVLATGSTWRGPLSFARTKEENGALVGAWQAKFGRAREVAIVGGGAVGLELAGEVKEFYPKTTVTIVHNQRLPLNDAYPDKFRKAILKRWQGAGIKFVLDDSVDLPTEPGVDVSGPLRTSSGKTIEADLIVQMVGGRPNTAIVSTLDAGALSAGGRVKVLDTLQVAGHANVFAAGDIVEWTEQKTAFKATYHAKVVAANVASVLAGKPAAVKYVGPPDSMIFITLGPGAGAGFAPFLGGITIPGWLVKQLKGKDLLVGMTRKNLGYQ